MISRLRGTLLTRTSERVEIATDGGVVYQVDIPLTVFQLLPAEGEALEMRTVQVVREDAVALYGFLDETHREMFKRLLSAKGVGAKVALAMLSVYRAPRLARALVEKDLDALVQVPGVGKKTAERIALELADRVADLAVGATGDAGDGVRTRAKEAISALVSLGFSFADADHAVRAVLDEDDSLDVGELIRRSLARG